MKIVLFGGNGQVGWELRRSLSLFGDISVHGRDTVDFTCPEQVQAIIEGELPTIVVNATAYTAVDQAESDQKTAYQVNAQTVAVLAKACQSVNATLIHYSTDYVFDGTKEGAYLENDEAAPLSVYGASKRAGEVEIQASGCAYFIFRTSWVYAARGNNFAKTMIKLASERKLLTVVDDQFGAPTSAELIADVTALVVNRVIQSPSFAIKHSGIYHLVASGVTTWHGFAQYVLKLAEKMGETLKVEPEEVTPISTSDFPKPAQRPCNSRLNTQKLQTMLSISLPSWEYHVERMVTEYIEGIR